MKAGAEQWKKKAEVECENEGNAALAGAFLELSSFEFKKGNSMKGVASGGRAGTLVLALRMSFERTSLVDRRRKHPLS